LYQGIEWKWFEMQMATCCWNGLAWLAMDSSACGGSSVLGTAKAGSSWDLQNDSNLVLDLDHAAYRYSYLRFISWSTKKLLSAASSPAYRFS
jgi:hypothetical protein